MSAKDRRKATPIDLSADQVARLRAYARANGERSLAGAARRALRAAAGQGRDVRVAWRAEAAPAGDAGASKSGRAKLIALQLEDSLRALLAEAGVEPDQPDALRAAIDARLRARAPAPPD